MAFDRAAFKYRGSNAVLNFSHFIGTHNVNPVKDLNKKLSPMLGGAVTSHPLAKLCHVGNGEDEGRRRGVVGDELGEELGWDFRLKTVALLPRRAR
ncbi:hypothetical protein L1887_28449 [Cichorium endivia]|nr:hypothetical protein L1887_28449 [Cichorium endivia]